MNVAPPVLHAAPAVVGEQGSRPRILEAAAGRSAIQEVDPDGPMLPPAGAARADTVVVTAGTVLLLILAVAFSGPCSAGGGDRLEHRT
ncbi:hypothetical protein [Microvirga yunnanensis]|uniref:hypothetical protein n=1 Tax=Microvirga yunnanensis TaxID=2953740 RepID=UPI0021C86B85|nr:hypothetical protein [Microvirga sp. HBU65207]